MNERQRKTVKEEDLTPTKKNQTSVEERKKDRKNERQKGWKKIEKKNEKKTTKKEPVLVISR